MTTEALLPTNQTSLEAALAQVMRPTVDPDVIRTLWDADRCPAPSCRGSLGRSRSTDGSWRSPKRRDAS